MPVVIGCWNGPEYLKKAKAYIKQNREATIAVSRYGGRVSKLREACIRSTLEDKEPVADHVPWGGTEDTPYIKAERFETYHIIQ